METMFTIEQLDMVLDYPTIDVDPHDEDSGKFDRYRSFRVDGVSYKIKWFCNFCTLYCGDVEVLFRWVKRTGTWPNHAKLNLQFYDDRNSVCCVLPIEYY